jgi:hypothetical protein
MLTGPELLAYAEANKDLNQTQLARGAGYVRETKAGKAQVLVKAFYQALLQAKGLTVRVGKAPGKTACFTTTVHRSGVILVGKIYTQRFGLEAGNELDIVLEEDCIKLVPKPAEVVPACPPKLPSLTAA